MRVDTLQGVDSVYTCRFVFDLINFEVKFLS